MFNYQTVHRRTHKMYDRRCANDSGARDKYVLLFHNNIHSGNVLPLSIFFWTQSQFLVFVWFIENRFDIWTRQCWESKPFLIQESGQFFPTTRYDITLTINGFHLSFLHKQSASTSRISCGDPGKAEKSRASSSVFKWFCSQSISRRKRICRLTKLMWFIRRPR